MIDQQVLDQLLEVYDLPTLPVIMTRILDTLGDDRASASDLTELLRQDHALSARVLRLANSAYYGRREPVETLHRCVVVLGFNQVRNIALATSLFDTFAKRRQFAFDPGDFWMHSFGTAKAVAAWLVWKISVDMLGLFNAETISGRRFLPAQPFWLLRRDPARA